MSSSKRLFGCTLADVSGTKKARRPIQLKLPPFPKGLRSTVSEFSSVDSTLLTSTPPDEISPNLYTCPICLGIPILPVQLSNCGHIGCVACFRKHLELAGVTRNGWEQRLVAACPMCRVEFAEDSLKSFATWLPLCKAVYRLLQTDCRLASGPAPLCNWNGPIIDLLNHESYDCPARRIACPNPFCLYIESEAKVREHFSTCKYLQVRCTDCFLPFRWESRETHNCEQTLMDALRGKCLIFKNIEICL
jgi:hypothetical protein